MSAFPLFSSVPVRRPFFMPKSAMASGAISAKTLLTTSLPNVVPASRLEVRPTPELVSSGIHELDALTGGLPRGCLTEVCGQGSSGRTSLLLAILASSTERQESCTLVDVSDAFDPLSAAAAGVNFARLLWVRCGTHQIHRREGHDFSRAISGCVKTAVLAAEGKKKNSAATPVEQALRVTDLLLQSGGFGLVVVDLADVPFQMARRIPLTTWFRFQRAVEHTPTMLFVITPAPCAQTCASLLLKVQAIGKKPSAFSSQLAVSEIPSHTTLLEGLDIQVEVLRSRMPRKPSRSVTAAFISKARFG